MKIIELHAENVKRLKAVQIRPTGPLVEIAGRNGQGKSSVPRLHLVGPRRRRQRAARPDPQGREPRP